MKKASSSKLANTLFLSLPFAWLDRVTPVKAFLVIGVLSMAILLLITPPYTAPDETTHFKRAYSISIGKIWPEYNGETPGFWGPDSIQRSIESYFGPGSYPSTFSFWREQIQRPLDPEIETFMEFRPEAIYMPLGYLPQSAGILLGRAIGATPVEMVYLSRLGNLVFSIALIAWALRHIPSGHEPVLLVALLPMTQHLLASASPDAMTIAGGILFTAASWRALIEDNWQPRQVALIVFAGILMCSTRWIYAPLMCVGAAALFTGERTPQRWAAAAIQVVAAVTVFLASSAWSDNVGSFSSASTEGTDVLLHMELLKTEPFSTGIYLVASFIHDIPLLIAGILGIFGWSNIYMPVWFYAFLALLVPLSLVATARRTTNGIVLASGNNLRIALWIACLVGIILMLVQVGLFLIATRVGAPYVEGVQGRYFQPLLPISLLVLVSVFKLDRLGETYGRTAYAALLIGLAIGSTGAIFRMVSFFQML